MKLAAITEMKSVAGYQKGCLCRFRYSLPLKAGAKVERVLAMGCPVHEKQTPAVDEPEACGSQAGTTNKVIPAPSPESVVHGKLGDPAPGPLFCLSVDGVNDVTLTGLGLALRMDRATLTALWRSTSSALDRIETLESRGGAPG